jgi:outer membrane protein TolC
MVPAEGPLAAWLADARRRHPDVLAAAARSAAARQRAEAVGLDFEDPVVATSAGVSDGPGQAPHVTLPRVLPADALSAQAGVEAPLGGGLYGGVGGAQRRLTSDGEEDGRWQTVAGARLRLPLWRDRGYGLMRHEEAQRVADALTADAEAQGVAETLARDIVNAYAAWLQDVADAREVSRAVDRAEKLLEQTTTRAELKVVAEYQVFPARFETALRREELEAARQQIRVGLQTLAERLGLAAPPPLPEGESDLLLRWADALAGGLPAEWTAETACRQRAECRAARARAEAAEAAVLTAAEELKGDLSVSAGASWESEDDAADATTSDEPVGFEVAVAFSRPWGRHGERSRLAAARADADARLSEVAAVDVQVASQVARARTAYEGACSRLALARGAVDEARRVLAAEDERFALGDGTSRSVLDAQKDLTSATRRSVAVAGQVVTAMADLRHALGIPQDDKAK